MSSYEQPEKGSPEETEGAREAAVLMAKEMGLKEEEDPGIFEIIRSSLIWKDEKNNYVIKVPSGERVGIEDWLEEAQKGREENRRSVQQAGARAEDNIKKARENSGFRDFLGDFKNKN